MTTTNRKISRRGLLPRPTPGKRTITAREGKRRTASNGPKIIVINERGGCDLMAKLGPYLNQDYAKLRDFTRMPDPASSPNTVHLTDLPEPFAIPRALEGILPAWNKNCFAFVVQTGTQFPSFSHFSKQDHLELGDIPDTACPQGDGFLARYLDHRAILDPTLAMLKSPRAIAFAPSRPLALRSTLSFAQKVLSSTDPYSLSFPGPDQSPYDMDYAATIQGLNSLSNTGLSSISESLFDGFDYIDALESQLGPSGYAPMGGATYGPDPIGRNFETIAAMCATPVSGHCPELFHLDVGGFDTHSDQDIFSEDPGTLGEILRHLGDALGAFFADMHARGIDYVVVSVSEFGRRAEESSSNGTDHGDGGIMMLMGPGVDGGRIHGQWGGLTDLVEGNLPATTDVRNVLAEILVAHALFPVTDLDVVFPSCAPNPYVYQPAGVMV